MARVLFIGDNHWGANRNSDRLLQQGIDVYRNFLFKIIENEKVDLCIDLGDFFDDREKVDIRVLQTVRNGVLNNLPVPWYFIVGNHNLYYRNSDRVNNLVETIGDLPNVHIVDTPQQICGIDMFPWISPTNVESIKNYLENTNAKYCAGHFEFDSFMFDRTRMANVNERIPANSFSKYTKVFSGHYHIASEKDNIIYVGAPWQLTAIDLGVEKRVLLLDTDTGEIQEYVNPNNLYAQYTLPLDGSLDGFTEDMFFGKRVKIIYNIDTPKDVINNVQAVLKTFNADSLQFVPNEIKKTDKKDTPTVSVTSGIQQSVHDYIEVLNPKNKEVIEKLFNKYYNQTNKEA